MDHSDIRCLCCVPIFITEAGFENLHLYVHIPYDVWFSPYTVQLT